MKTVRQRKDELLALIKHKNHEFKNKLTSVDPTKKQLYDEYKKILTSNGIKNEKLISAQLNKMIDANMPKTAVYSNLKFINLARSRLTEEGIPLQFSESIIEHLDFNLSEINEDDDYIGDVALHYAELAYTIYKELVDYSGNYESFNKLSDDLAEKFNIFPIQLPPA